MRRVLLHADVDSVGENLADNRVALPGDTRAATLKLEGPIDPVLPVYNDGGVSRYQV